jgi:hypothetical protein
MTQRLSASYREICAAIDREIKLREDMLIRENEKLREKLAVAEEHLRNIIKIGNYTAQGEAEEALSKISQ